MADRPRAPTTTATCAPALLERRARAGEGGARSSRCASSRARSASATPRRAATSPTSRRCSTRSRRTASSASARELRAAVDGAGADFDARLAALAGAYVRFATRHAALLELMFAGKHRPARPTACARPARRPSPRRWPDRRGPGGRRRGRPATPRRSAPCRGPPLQGLAAIVNGGMLDDAALDELVAGAVERLVLGLRPR